ncbi:MAG: transglutaminase family protein [Chrysiogenetes bacterium]|nr:transglutaminase family protein [Chrysiogenetes bacterium]
MSQTSEDLSEYLKPTDAIDCDHPDVIAFAKETVGDAGDEREKARRLFYAVRDSIRYNPYSADLSAAGMKASTTLKSKESFCVPKAVLLAAAARVVGIPSRLGFADVKNHLTTKRLQESMDTDLFVYHGYTELYLGGKWIKVTPTFNLSLCEKFGVHPLEFDGEHECIFHEFSKSGGKHMEYVRERGSYADLPLQEILDAWVEYYGTDFGARMQEEKKPTSDFEAEAAAEN